MMVRFGVCLCVYERHYIILHVINLRLKKIKFFPITDICELI